MLPATLISVAGAKQIAPFEGPLPVTGALSKMFDVAVAVPDCIFAIGATIALHGFKGWPYLVGFFFGGRDFVTPSVTTVSVVGEAGRGVPTMQPVHDVLSPLA